LVGISLGMFLKWVSTSLQERILKYFILKTYPRTHILEIKKCKKSMVAKLEVGMP